MSNGRKLKKIQYIEKKRPFMLPYMSKRKKSDILPLTLWTSSGIVEKSKSRKIINIFRKMDQLYLLPRGRKIEKIYLVKSIIHTSSP